MLTEPPATARSLRIDGLSADLCVVGGGLAGTCCALTAARAGARVVLVQDRPVLGGNASSEVRLWVLGATSHMQNNNRWAREGGVVDELLVENMHRNPEGNALIFDSILLEKVAEEPNITLLLNTAAFEVEKAGPDRIQSVRALCSQNSTLYRIEAPLFCDASGDGVLGFLSGAAFRMGAETAEAFGEKFAPDEAYGQLLGHSMYFYSKDLGRPVEFIPPSFALRDVEGVIPRYRGFNAETIGCRLWWIEYGGRLDTVHDSERIKWELWRVVYGVWDYIKNSGRFPEARNLALEWISTIPGKRESRRFEGDYMLNQRDIVEQRDFDDVVSFGGWSIDLHPADGVYSERKGCDQWHSKGVYGIPYRCLYSRNIDNLFLAGRIISATHVAFGSTRVMATCANGGQAAGMAAAICAGRRLLPRDLSAGDGLRQLQRDLLRSGQHVPGLTWRDDEDLAGKATAIASSELGLAELASGRDRVPLDRSRAQMLPIQPGPLPRVTMTAIAEAPTRLEIQVRLSSKAANHTPDVVLGRRTIDLDEGEQPIVFDFDATIDEPRYAFFCVMVNADVSLALSDQRVTGVLSVQHGRDQKPDRDIGVESFEMWTPERRPGGRNLACRIEPPLGGFEAHRVTGGHARPVEQPHAWVADWADRQPSLTLSWDQPQRIGRVVLMFDPDYDHPMESALWGHPEREMPFCVKRYRLTDAAGNVLHESTANHQGRVEVVLAAPAVTDRLTLSHLATHGGVPPAVFAVRCYAE